jgi:phage repressor protein C with HTH and peptisase S24 domain
MVTGMAIERKPDTERAARIKRLRKDILGKTQDELAQLLSQQGRVVTRGAVGNWELGKEVGIESLSALANVAHVSIEWLISGKGEPQRPDTGPNGHEPNARILGEVSGESRLIPVYGQAVGGVDGEFEMNGNILYEVMAPPQISEIRKAYAVCVSGDSMEPRYFDGEIAFVDPSRRVRRGDFVVAQIQAEEHSPKRAFIKRFVRQNSEELVLEQYNPPKELRFSSSEVQSVHYIALSGVA